MSSGHQPGTAGPNAVEPYSPALEFTRLAVGVDNLRHDVFLSPRWREQASKFLFEQILSNAQAHLRELYPADPRARGAAAGELRQGLGAVLQGSLTRAKEENNIEIDVLARLALFKWLLVETQHKFSALAVACKERVEEKVSGQYQKEMTEFVLRSKIADYQADRRHILRAVGDSLFQAFEELEETKLRPARLALFGSDFAEWYRVLRNRLLFLENPNDAVIHLEHYVMLGHFVNDPDHEERVLDLLAQLLREQGLALPEGDDLGRLEQRREKSVDELQELSHRLREVERELGEASQPEPPSRLGFAWLKRSRGEPLSAADRSRLEATAKKLEEQRQRLTGQVEELEQQIGFRRQTQEKRIAELLSNPANAEKLFGSLSATGSPEPRTEAQEAMLRQLYACLDRAGILKYVLASYHLKSVYKDFCPPVNPQQLKHAVADRKGWDELENLLDQYPAQKFPLDMLEEVAHRLRRLSREDAETLLVRFARDLMRLRRDFVHLAALSSLLEKIHLVGDDKTRQVSRLNRTLYEFLLPEEREAGEEHVLTHVVVKADVRDSTRITEELLRRSLNPATHFSNNFYEPVHKLMERYSASKIFIEGDALILGIYETPSNRASQRAVAKACLLAKEIVHVCQAYNQRAGANDLPALELGLGIAYQASAPHYWTDGESRIMISSALNHSDRLASCTKVARRLMGENNNLFRVFCFQGAPPPGLEEMEDQFFFRYNVMGVALNQEGFEKLQQEISLTPVQHKADLLGRSEEATLYCGTVPIGNGFEKLIIREARVARLRLPEARLEEWMPRVYYEVCVHPRLYEQFSSSPA